MMILLLYVGLIMPYNVCFIPPNPFEFTPFDMLDLFIDILFCIDIVVNFFSAYDDPATDLPVINIKIISSDYIYSWFFLDLVAVIPFSLLENVGTNGKKSNGCKLSRLARLPRLYRLIRILRMIKMLRIVKK